MRGSEGRDSAASWLAAVAVVTSGLAVTSGVVTPPAGASSSDPIAYIPSGAQSVVLRVDTVTDVAGVADCRRERPDRRRDLARRHDDVRDAPRRRHGRAGSAVATNKVGSPIPVGSLPGPLAITPDGKTVYVVNTGSDSVTPSRPRRRRSRPPRSRSVPRRAALRSRRTASRSMSRTRVTTPSPRSRPRRTRPALRSRWAPSRERPRLRPTVQRCTW